jgi:hypothetical protein
LIFLFFVHHFQKHLRQQKENQSSNSGHSYKDHEKVVKVFDLNTQEHRFFRLEGPYFKSIDTFLFFFVHLSIPADLLGKRAFINTIGEAKQLRNGGRFKSEKHLRQCIGARLGRAIPALLKSGLLMLDGDGAVHVSNSSRYQVDATSNVRQKNWRERARSESGGITETKHHRERAEKEQRENNPLTPLSAGEILRRVMP